MLRWQKTTQHIPLKWKMQLVEQGDWREFNPFNELELQGWRRWSISRSETGKHWSINLNLTDDETPQKGNWSFGNTKVEEQEKQRGFFCCFFSWSLVIFLEEGTLIIRVCLTCTNNAFNTLIDHSHYMLRIAFKSRPECLYLQGGYGLDQQ